MSNYPPAPPSGLPSNYPQWPSSNPQSSAIPPLVSPNPSFHQNLLPPHQQPQGPMGRSYDYNNDLNFNTNARLPGLGAPAAAGPLPTPPFPYMGNFTPPQFPPAAFSPAQMPPLGYPPMPLPTAFNAPPSRPSSGDFHTNHFNSQHASTSNSLQDIDREEGELTDREGGLPPSQKPASNSGPSAPPASLGGQLRPSANASEIPAVNGAHRSTMTEPPGSNKSKGLAPKNPYKPASRDSMDLEEGETSSSQSASSSRDSGSPYNPPISMTIEGLDGMDIEPAVTPQPTTETSVGKCPSKSPAQLRIQAQGALLGLAPHNIRYNELVGEGINPNILKQLYEEVGIKVSTPQPDGVPTAGPENTHEHGREIQTTETSKTQKASTQIPPPDQNVTPPVSSTPAPLKDTAKPMERKEVIARMLAAKAAKASGASESPQADGPEEKQGRSSASRAENATSLEAPVKEKEVRAKEKNKAQTELARQRIEQLKKQGLMRNQPKPQPDPKPIEPERSNGENQISDTADEGATIQHALPERPPDPESDSSARIPGLFMTGSKEDLSQDAYVTPVQGLVIDSTPQLRANQRKRPRASDFDEPIYMAKTEYNNGVPQAVPEQRLIIDISDDEFYDDKEDDGDSMDIETSTGYVSRDNGSTAPETSLRALESLPSRPLSSQAFSTPQPNSRGSDQDHLRRKNLEIQAMHRRIAELEQRKKAKLTVSRTQSPRSVELPLPTPPEPSAAPEAESYNIDSADAQADGRQAPQNGHSSGQISPPSMDLAYFENMRSRILRKMEIESGVPALDAEIRKSESRLADLKTEEGKVLLEISRGKEGRKQLQEELNNINVELNGLTLDEIDAALVRLKTKPQDNSTLEVPPTPVNGNDQPVVETTSIGDPSREESGVDQLSDKSDKSDQALSTGLPDMPVDTQSRVDSNHESSAVSSSESEGSAMDESSDSDSEDSMSIDEDESEDPEPVAESSPRNTASEPRDIIQEAANQPSANSQHSLPEDSPVPNKENRSSVASRSDEEMREDDSSDSSSSDAYEPPEPETTASPANSVYSPPFSPPPPGPIEPSEASMPTMDQTNPAGEPLTAKVQEVDVESPKENIQVGLLDNTREAELPQRKFSPYDSPLKHFNAYRYHPNYSGDTTQGFRSLTYSHNIDPMKYLCPFEAAGGVCNDRSCEFQHFRDMTLSDDKILVQMGSLREGKTPEEKDQYIAGLKQIINDMRRDKVKDFNTVATEIAAYRRRFLQDPSRILPL